MKFKSIKGLITTAIFSLISAVWVLPVVIVFYNSFKSNQAIKTDLISFPNGNSFIGIENYIKGIFHGN